MRVKFLGTGTPFPNAKRCGQGIMVSHEQYTVLFDCGPGVNRRIIESNIQHNDVTDLFLSHLHWDHFGDFGDFVQTGFITNREVPLRVFGPPGTQEISDLLFKQVYYRDILYRKGNRGPESCKEPVVEELFGGIKLQSGPFTIKTFRVHHGEFVDWSFAFRIECEGKSVVISGDTAPVLGFTQFSKECSLLIHEVMPGKPGSLKKVRPELTAEQVLKMMGHSSPHQVGVIAHEAMAGKLVLTHLPPNLPDNLIDLVAENYRGPIEIAQELMEVDV